MGADHHRLCSTRLAHVAAAAAIHGRRMIQNVLVAALVVAATWDAWRWYVQRVWESPEESASLVLTVVFLGALGVARRRNDSMPVPLIPVAFLLAAFAGSYAFLPPIARAAIAVAATLY